MRIGRTCARVYPIHVRVLSGLERTQVERRGEKRRRRIYVHAYEQVRATYRTPELARRRSPRDRPINQAPLLARRSFAIAVGSEGTLSTILLSRGLSVLRGSERFRSFGILFFPLLPRRCASSIPTGDIAMNRATWKEHD